MTTYQCFVQLWEIAHFRLKGAVGTLGDWPKLDVPPGYLGSWRSVLVGRPCKVLREATPTSQGTCVPLQLCQDVKTGLMHSAKLSHPTQKARSPISRLWLAERRQASV